jgi:DinB superfamily
MKRRAFLFAIGFTLAVVAGVHARRQELSQTDRNKALDYLESTRKNLLEATKGLSEAQWNFKPAPDRWSVAQCMEHIAAAEDFLRGMVTEQVMKAPNAPDRDLSKTDETVLSRIPDRSHKVEAPEPLRPTNRYGSPDGSLKHFQDSRATTEAFLKNTPDLRQHAIDSPMGVKLDAYEWILFISAHSERHTKQILEVKADPNFPKN